IEVLIRDEHLKRFVQRKENPRPEHREASAVEEEKPATGGQEPKHHRIGEKKVRGAHRRIFEYESHPRQGKVQILASRILS
ncbi:hypothetical protein A2U01_0068198, partial [Trifolium medium]|nr:hypothetical protein [Trifolium medium]